MHVHIGSDHGGFRQKEMLKRALQADGMSLGDLGYAELDEGDDYPPIAAKVGQAVAQNPETRGILFCRSGEGMAMAANKVAGVRAALAWNVGVAEETRRDNDANVLVLPSDFVSDEEALAISRAFLSTPFSGEERHARRIAEISQLEGL